MLRTANFRLSGQELFLDFKFPFKILAKAEPRLWRGEATIAQNPNSENWRYLLVKIRTFFDENPDCELWRSAPPLADARHPAKKFSSHFLFCARLIFSFKRDWKLFCFDVWLNAKRRKHFPLVARLRLAEQAGKNSFPQTPSFLPACIARFAGEPPILKKEKK